MKSHASYSQIRLFVEAPLGSEGTQLPLPAETVHYLGRVMRAKLGDTLALFNGTDGEWQAEISVLEKKHGAVTLTKKLREQTSTPDVTLCFSPLKQNRQDWLVEKAAELGVRSLQPVVMNRSQVRDVNLERLKKITIEAAEQCERLEIPTIKPLLTLEQLVGSWDAATPLLMADELGAGEPLPAVMQTLTNDAGIGLLIGPEGGFSSQDLDILARATYIKRMTLGPRILRAETAALTALSIVLAHAGDWHLKPAFRGDA